MISIDVGADSVAIVDHDEHDKVNDNDDEEGQGGRWEGRRIDSMTSGDLISRRWSVRFGVRVGTRIEIRYIR